MYALGVQRFLDGISLRKIAADAAQIFQCFETLDALGCSIKTQTVPKVDDGFDNGS